MVVPRFIRERWQWWFGGGAAIYATGLVLFRGAPTTSSDAGIFLSVAARLLRGDRLYVDVWDNKGPLFYYTYAGALWILGWRGPFLLDAVWLTIAAIFSALLVRSIGGSRLLAAIAFLLYPLLLTGTWYSPGYSRLAALSIVPPIGWLWLRRNFAWAGVFIGVGMLFDLGLTLILLSVPLALLALGIPDGRRRSQAVRATAGLVVAGGVAAALLALAGELRGYLHTMTDNITYADNVLVDTGREGGIRGHIHVAESAIPNFGFVRTLFLLAGLIAVFLLVKAWRARTIGTAESVVAALFLSTSLIVALTLATTAAWSHHDLVLALPATLLVLLVLTQLGLIRWLIAKAVAMAAFLALSMVLLGGTIGGTRVLTRAQGLSISAWFRSPLDNTAVALNQVRREQLPGLAQVTYAHLGKNDEEAHAVFLDSEFKLACPVFHQYPFTENLQSVLRCVEQKRPRLILVTTSFAIGGGPEQWNTFVEDGQRLLKQRYVLALTRPDPNGAVQVWKLRPSSS